LYQGKEKRILLIDKGCLTAHHVVLLIIHTSQLFSNFACVAIGSAFAYAYGVFQDHSSTKSPC